MLTGSDRRGLLERAIRENVPAEVEVRWLAPEHWSAHARLTGPTGTVGYLLTSPHWQEARFTQPHSSAFTHTDSEDPDEVSQALNRLTRLVTAYTADDYEIEQERGWFRTRTILVVHTADGLWRIGKRWSIRLTDEPC